MMHRFEDDRTVTGCAVDNNEGWFRKARGLVTVEEAKGGDGCRDNQITPEFRLMRTIAGSRRPNSGAAAAKRGSIEKRAPGCRFYPYDNRVMHIAPGKVDEGRCQPIFPHRGPRSECWLTPMV